MLGGVDSEPGPPRGRRREIDARLDAVRARLGELRERDPDAVRYWSVSPGQRLDAAQRHAAEAQAAAAVVLAACVEAFGRAAEAHERVAGVHERAAAAGLGDVGVHERQAALHRAAVAADRLRAGRAQSVVSVPAAGGTRWLSAMSQATAWPDSGTGLAGIRANR